MSLFLKTPNYQLPVHSCYVQSSIEQYYTIFTITTEQRILDRKFTLCKDALQFDLYILNEEFRSPGFSYICIPVEAAELMDVSYPPFNGVTDLKGLLRKLGVPNHIKVNTPQIHWNVPRLKIVSLIDYLNSHAPVGSDGVRFYITESGELGCISFGPLLDLKPLQISVEQHPPVRSSLDWLSRIPSTINITRYLPLDIEQYKLTLYTGISEGNMKINDTTSTVLDKTVVELSNDFYFQYYTSMKFTMKLLTPTPLQIGAVVTIPTISKEKLIVLGCNYTIKSDAYSEVSINASHPDTRCKLVVKNTLKKL